MNQFDQVLKLGPWHHIVLDDIDQQFELCLTLCRVLGEIYGQIEVIRWLLQLCLWYFLELKQAAPTFQLIAAAHVEHKLSGFISHLSIAAMHTACNLPLGVLTDCIWEYLKHGLKDGYRKSRCLVEHILCGWRSQL